MIKVNLVGDIGLNNKYQNFRKGNINPFEEVEDLFAKADLNIGNLECLCHDNFDENNLKLIRLRTKGASLDLLKPLNFSMLSLAHNHLYDNCEEGIAYTLNKLHELDIQPIGYSPNADDNPYVWKTEAHGLPIAVITAVHPDTNPHLPENVNLNVPWYDADNIVSEIRGVKASGYFAILFLHWGGMTEEGFMPDWYEIQDAHRFVDEGADIVVGGHSHTIQPYEKYKGKYIFYSLGNFCFDDIEMNGVTYPIGRYRKRKGLIISLSIQSDGSYEVKEQRIRNRQGIIKRESGKLKLQLRNFRFKLLEHCKPLWNFNFRWFRKVSPLFIYLFESPDSFRVKLSKFKLNKLMKHLKS